eukprot:TRINITY_DN26162_c0_g1_i1.p1 TRINITY_DN26162_c0_g1~~TRINITY_DN26162_c0_g1_i1.p1  ORF type:complete len:450 (+),score=83.78 TRINITY_DN26162_c0_g1_i1:74-1423(+)
MWHGRRESSVEPAELAADASQETLAGMLRRPAASVLLDQEGRSIFASPELHGAARALDAAEHRIRQLEESLHRKHSENGAGKCAPPDVSPRRGPPEPPPPAPIPPPAEPPALDVLHCTDAAVHPYGPPPPARPFSHAEEAEVRRLRELRELSERRVHEAEQCIRRSEEELAASRGQQELLNRLGALRRDAPVGPATARLESERTRLLLIAGGAPAPSPLRTDAASSSPRRAVSPRPAPPLSPPLPPPPPPSALPPPKAGPPCSGSPPGIQTPERPLPQAIARALSPRRRPRQASAPPDDPTMESLVEARVQELITRARLRLQCGINAPCLPPQTASPRCGSRPAPAASASPERMRRPLSAELATPSPVAVRQEQLAGDGLLEVIRAGRGRSGPDAEQGVWLAWHRQDLRPSEEEPSREQGVALGTGSPARSASPASPAAASGGAPEPEH